MRKNVAGQTVGAQLINKTDGSPVTTGTTDVYVTGDGGTQALSGVSPSGAVHEGNGYWSYPPSQADTNYDHVAFTFVNSNAINATVQIYTSYPQTGDNYARLGAAVGSPSAQTISDDLLAILGRLPSALVSGRMDASVGAMAANVLTATAIASDAITDAKVASDVTIASVTGAVGSVTGNVGGNVAGSVGSIATGGIASSSFAAGAIDAAAIATDAIGSLELSAGAVAEIQSGLSTLDAAGVRAAVGLASANLDTQIGTLATAANLATVAGYVDTEVASIKAVTDKLNTTMTSVGSPTDYVFTAEALALAPTGGTTPPTAAAIADAVWDEALAGHLSAGSTGEQLNNAASAGNPWASIIEGSYTAEDILRILAAVAVGKDSITTLGNGQAVVVFRDITDASDIVTANMTNSARTSVTLAP